MPAFSVNTPTVQVSIPVPGPANTGPKPAPKPKPAPAPQPVAVAPVDPRAGGPRAVIMPHATPPRRMARPGKPRRYMVSNTDAMLRAMHDNPEDRTARLVAADAFDEADDPHTAAALRSDDPVWVTPRPEHIGGYNVKRMVNGTTYDAGTPEAVIRILDHAIRTGRRLRVHYGHQTGEEAGKDWLEEHDVSGRVGRSMGSGDGRNRVPLLIPSTRSFGGSSILTDNVVRIRETPGGRELWRHPQYRHGAVELRQWDKPLLTPDRRFLTHGLWIDGKNHANFTSPERALRWAKAMGLTVGTPPATPEKLARAGRPRHLARRQLRRT